MQRQPAPFNNNDSTVAPPGTQDRDARELAARCISVLQANASMTRQLGIRIVESGPGYAHLTMAIRPDMANVHRFCHGGMLFTLSDEALFYACHTYNQNLVTSGTTINFLSSAQVGEVLHAHGRCRHWGAKRGVGEVEIRKDDGTVVAVSLGTFSRIPGTVTDG